MSFVANIEQFRARKAALIAKWGDKLLHHTTEELVQIHADCAPLAKYAKMPAQRIHMALIETMTRNQEAAK